TGPPTLLPDPVAPLASPLLTGPAGAIFGAAGVGLLLVGAADAADPVTKLVALPGEGAPVTTLFFCGAGTSTPSGEVPFRPSIPFIFGIASGLSGSVILAVTIKTNSLSDFWNDFDLKRLPKIGTVLTTGTFARERVS